MALPAITIFGYPLAIFLSTVLVQIGWILLKSIGISSITYLGSDLLIGYFEDYFAGSLTEMQTVAPALYAAYGLLNIDVLVNSLFSSLALFFSIKGFCGAGKLTSINFGREGGIC